MKGIHNGATVAIIDRRGDPMNDSAEPSNAASVRAGDALPVLASMRQEKWQSIQHSDEMDLKALKSIFTIATLALGANVVYERFGPGALSWIWFAGVSVLIALVCWLGAASMCRNYVVYLRALEVITALEDEMRSYGLRLEFQAHTFRSPATATKFAAKFIRTTRFAYLVLYVLAALAALAMGVYTWVHRPGVGVNATPGYLAFLAIALIFVGSTLAMLYWHWTGYDRVDGAGVLVLSRADIGLEVLLLVGQDGKLTLSKGHRRTFESGRKCACRELGEETGITLSSRQLRRDPLITVLEREPIAAQPVKRVRLWAAEFNPRPPVRPDQPSHSSYRWLPLVEDQLQSSFGAVRGPHVVEVLKAAAAHARLGDYGHVIADVRLEAPGDSPASTPSAAGSAG